MGFSPSDKHQTTSSIFSNIVDATSGSFTTSLTVSGTAVDISGGGNSVEYALLRDEKSNGTNGGTFTAGARRTRVLNTKVVDEIGITLSSNQFTLPAGTYIVRGHAPALQGGRHKAWLRNITDSSDTIIGTADDNTQCFANSSTSFLRGKFTLVATKTFEIQHQMLGTRNNTGFGAASSFGDNEVYTTIEITKII